MKAPYSILVALVVLLASCRSYPPLPTESNVDIDRFMGDWYVHGHIPASSEKNAYNGVESYERTENGRIQTTYAFREGGFDGPIEVMRPSARIVDKATNAEWSMRFYWFFSAEYLIAHVDEAYTETIIARTKRDYAWIMSRDPVISDERYAALATKLVELGYETTALRRVPQRWPDPGHPSIE